MTHGRLVAIYTATAAGKPMTSVASIRAIRGQGLEGDRYAAHIGKYSDQPGLGREVTLFEREVIRAVNDEGDVTLGEHETRRNLLTEGVKLDDLVGKQFRVGTVVLVGRRPATPCSYLAGLTRPGVSRALTDRGGLRADIVAGGVLHVGDEITAVDDEDGHTDVRG
jgi:MOSC domain-containing protein YiiM